MASWRYQDDNADHMRGDDYDDLVHVLVVVGVMVVIIAVLAWFGGA